MDNVAFRIQQQLDEINEAMQRPGIEKLTSLQMRARADAKRQMATSLKLQGKKLKKGYE